MNKITSFLVALTICLIVSFFCIFSVFILNSVFRHSLAEIPLRWLLPRALTITSIALLVVVLPTLLLSACLRLVIKLFHITSGYSSKCIWAATSATSALILVGLASTVQLKGGEARFCWIYLADGPGCVIMTLLSPYFLWCMVPVSAFIGWLSISTANLLATHDKLE